MLACRGPCRLCGSTWNSSKSRQVCPRCCNARSRAKNPATRAAYNVHSRLKRVYGLSVVQYLAQVQHQQGKCASCGRKPSIALSVDHNHDTGAVRELLCNGCNLALGHMGENPDAIRRLAAYAERHLS